MTTFSSTPAVTTMQVIPVAGHDSMLMNLSGAHAPYFTRNIVIIKDNAGHTGVGEIRAVKKFARPRRMPFRWWWAKRWASIKTCWARCAISLPTATPGPRPADL